MPLRVRIAGLLIAAGSFGPAAADQPDTVKAVTPGGPGVLTKCRGWVVTSSCRTYHHISLPSRIAVGDTITISFGSHPKEFGFSVARIDLKGQHCARSSAKLKEIATWIRSTLPRVTGQTRSADSAPSLSDDLFGAQRFDRRSADAGPSAELFRIAHRTHPSDERSCGRHNTEPQIRRFDDPLSQVTVMRGQCPRVGAGPAAAARAQLLLLDRGMSRRGGRTFFRRRKGWGATRRPSSASQLSWRLIIFRWGLPVALQLTDAPAPRHSARTNAMMTSRAEIAPHHPSIATRPGRNAPARMERVAVA